MGKKRKVKKVKKLSSEKLKLGKALATASGVI